MGVEAESAGGRSAGVRRLGALEEVVRFLTEAADGWSLEHEFFRKRLELRQKRLLRNVEAFKELAFDFEAQCLDRERVATYQRLNREEKDRERTREAEVRREVVEELQARVIDATHFRDAAYAHVLVTDDENFRAVAMGARAPLVIQTLAEFAESVGLPSWPGAGLTRAWSSDVLIDQVNWPAINSDDVTSWQSHPAMRRYRVR